MSTAPLVEDILELEAEEAMETSIRESFSYQTIGALQRYLDLTQTELAAALGGSRQPIIRNQKERKRCAILVRSGS